MTFEMEGSTLLQIYQCRCGETHRGEYAAEDWAHHNCFHGEGLSVDAGDCEAICPLCGEVFKLVQRRLVFPIDDN